MKSTKPQTWLTRDAEQKFCKIHPKVIGIDEAGNSHSCFPFATKSLLSK